MNHIIPTLSTAVFSPVYVGNLGILPTLTTQLHIRAALVYIVWCGNLFWDTRYFQSINNNEYKRIANKENNRYILSWAARICNWVVNVGRIPKFPTYTGLKTAVLSVGMMW